MIDQTHNASATEVEIATHLMQETRGMTYQQALRIARDALAELPQLDPPSMFHITGLELPQTAHQCKNHLPDPSKFPLYTTIEVQCPDNPSYSGRQPYIRGETRFRQRPVWRYNGYTGSD